MKNAKKIWPVGLLCLLILTGSAASQKDGVSVGKAAGIGALLGLGLGRGTVKLSGIPAISRRKQPVVEPRINNLRPARWLPYYSQTVNLTVPLRRMIYPARHES